MFCFNFFCITVGSAFACSDFYMVSSLGFVFDDFCVTLSFFASHSVLVLNWGHCQALLYFMTEDGLKIIRKVS